MAKKPLKIKVENCLICDDVRQEDNNKFILVGVYRNAALVEEFPAAINLSVWIELYANKKGKAQIEIRGILKPGRKEIFKSSGELDIQSVVEKAYLIIRGKNVPFEKPNDLVIQFKQGNGRWKEIRRMQIDKISSTSFSI